MNIRHATSADTEFLLANRRHISAPLMHTKIEHHQVYIAEHEEAITGWARYGLFWDNTPFLNLIYILPPYRHKGFGSALLTFWESEMREQGHPLVLTSTQSDEQGQFFYRNQGYRDCGALLLPDEPTELILLKQL